MNAIINISAFIVLGILWLGFAVALVVNPALLDTAWQFFRGLPMAGQIVLGLLLLPVVLGLWIWESPWPFWVRLALVIGLGIATIYTFYPKKA